MENNLLQKENKRLSKNDMIELINTFGDNISFIPEFNIDEKRNNSKFSFNVIEENYNVNIKNQLIGGLFSLLNNPLNKLRDEIFEYTKSNGFHEEDNTHTLLLLIHSELSESVEALRIGKVMTKERKEIFSNSEFNKDLFVANIKDTHEDEIADTLIRLLDYCGFKNIDIDWHVKQKMIYNKTRGYKHGKEF